MGESRKPFSLSHIGARRYADSVILSQPNQAKPDRKYASMDKYSDRIAWALQMWTGPFRDWRLSPAIKPVHWGGTGYVEDEGNECVVGRLEAQIGDGFEFRGLK